VIYADGIQESFLTGIIHVCRTVFRVNMNIFILTDSVPSRGDTLTLFDFEKVK